MSSLLCHSGTWGSLGNFGVWGWVGVILNLVFWVGLLAALTLLVVLAVRSARVPVAAGEPSAKEILQAQYVRGEITREQYELRKQDIG
ncbi:MAG TPA: SHOCT domain-containing protein [Anaerolineales bacterium]|jgi:putative membrane protein|nr:SHOCT domain-containing protein [Anaerolineales bacterium]